MKITDEVKKKPVTTTFNVWVKEEVILFAYLDESGNWFFSEIEGSIDFDDSFLVTVHQLLMFDKSLKLLPELAPKEKAKRNNINSDWVKYI